MKLFKNGISLKWLLLVIGTVAITGYAVASVNPIISNTNSYFDVLYINYLHGDITNATGILPNASIPTSAANLSASNTFTGTGITSFAGNVGIGTAGLGSKLDVNGDVSIPYGSGYRFGNDTNWKYSAEQSPSGANLVTLQALVSVTGQANDQQGWLWRGHTGTSNMELTGASGNLYIRGKVGIGTTNPSYKLQVSGTLGAPGLTQESATKNWLCYDTVTGEIQYYAGTCTVSDMRLKENVSVIKTTIPIRNKFMNIEIIKYQEINDNSHTWRYGINSTKLGQDFPMLVNFDNNGTAISIKYELVSILNTLIIQEQQQRIDSLESRVQTLEKQIDYLYNNFNLTKP